MKRRILSVILAALLIFSVIPLSFAFAKAIGDVDGNGTVAAADARLALRASVGLETFDEETKKAADVNFDGQVQASDARIILRASVGLEELKDPHTHSYASEVTKQANCTEKGIKTFTCECGDTYTEDIEATGHTEVKDAAVAPACTATGKTEGSHCSVCNTVIKAQTAVPAAGHTEVKDNAVAPTCTAAGKTEGSHCSVCNTVIKAQEDVPATGIHVESELDSSTVKKVTCRENGYTGDEKCKICGAVTKTGEVITSTGEEHEMGTVSVEASCTQDGYTATKCKNCEYFIESTYVPGEKAKGHTFGTPEIINPTCTEQGYTLETCTVCKADSKTNYTDAEGHSYDWKTTKAATCEETGSRTGTCSVCGNVTTEIIGLQACTPSTRTTKIAGSKDNNISCKEVIECTVCEKVISEAQTDNAHITTQSNTTLATCTEDGTKDLACRYCNYTKHVTYEAAKGHTNDKAVRVEPTCTADGYVEFSGECTRCNETFDSTTIVLKAKGHNPTGVQTCTTSVTCTVCRETLENALGHDYSVTAAAYNTDIDTFFCSRCGAQTDDALAVFNNIANKIIERPFYNSFSKLPNIYYVDKTAIDTSYSRFDFGIYTSAIRSLYEDEMANTPDDYSPVRRSSIIAQLPLRADRTAVSLLTQQDIDSITVEKLTGIKISDVLSDYATKYTVGTTEYDLTKYKNVTINEDVIKVTIDVKNEKYSQVKNLKDDELTSLQKIYDINIRDDANEYKNENGELKMTETESGDGYEISMTMSLREITSDAKVTYYFKADTYEPIIALYNTDMTMDQTIDMSFKIGLFSLNGELDPIISTNYTRAYLFPNFFEQY